MALLTIKETLTPSLDQCLSILLFIMSLPIKKVPHKPGGGFYARVYAQGNADPIAGSDLLWIFVHSVVDILLIYIKKGDVK